MSLNPLKRVNSILTLIITTEDNKAKYESQSPQTGQFNSNHSITIHLHNIPNEESQSPQTGQFNSNTMMRSFGELCILVSIPSNGSIQF